jgi:C-terminus of AA_permease
VESNALRTASGLRRVVYLRKSDAEVFRPFCRPAVPWAPSLGIAFSLLLIVLPPWPMWLRLIVWLAFGLVRYFAYGRSRSVLISRLVLTPTRSVGDRGRLPRRHGACSSGSRHARASRRALSRPAELDAWRAGLEALAPETAGHARLTRYGSSLASTFAAPGLLSAAGCDLQFPHFYATGPIFGRRAKGPAPGD